MSDFCIDDYLKLTLSILLMNFVFFFLFFSSHYLPDFAKMEYGVLERLMFDLSKTSETFYFIKISALIKKKFFVKYDYKYFQYSSLNMSYFFTYSFLQLFFC